LTRFSAPQPNEANIIASVLTILGAPLLAAFARSGVFRHLIHSIYNRKPMTLDRIAELLQPFLTAPVTHSSCHSEPGRRRGEEPAFPASCENARTHAELSLSQLQYISTYIDLLLRWNARINLTAIRDPEEIVTRHFGESLFAARCLFLSAPSTPLTVADIGSGAGFPGLPIKLWSPQIELTLIESNHKKATFLREITRALTLTNVNITIARAESLIEPSQTRLAQPASATPSFDIVTMRAVERFESILATAISLVAPQGRLALLISAAQLNLAQHHPIVSSTNLSWQDAVPMPSSGTRIVAIAQRAA
jgi:16S rRNA (guanine527-N7)-methyltransferase